MSRKMSESRGSKVAKMLIEEYKHIKIHKAFKKY